MIILSVESYKRYNAVVFVNARHIQLLLNIAFKYLLCRYDYPVPWVDNNDLHDELCYTIFTK